MKILLVNPPYGTLGGIKGHGGAMPPLNLLYLAAYARQQQPDLAISLCDAECEALNVSQTAQRCLAEKPDLIGITANTCVFDAVINLCRQLKKVRPRIPIIIGGPHPSALPASSLTETGADFAAVGEGEITLTRVIALIRQNADDWSTVPGLAFRHADGGITVNEKRDLISDLDALPLPARDLIDNTAYLPAPTKRVSLGPTTLIAASRGCPFNCGFCGAQTVWTRRIRSRSPASVVGEIETCISQYGIRAFSFTDEFFTADKNHVLEICRLIINKGLRIRWVCSARAQSLKADILKAMKAAGCHEISFGIESGSKDILRRIDKRIDLEEAERVIRLTKKVGIITHASYIIGYLGETEATIKETIALSRRLNTHLAAFFIASPLPGTRLYQQAASQGALRENATWFDYSPLSNSDSVLQLPGLDTASIRRWHRKAVRGYYLRWGYILMRLRHLRHPYEIKNLFDGLRLLLNLKS